MRYGAIYADPPWRFATWDRRDAVTVGHGNASAAVHYGTMTTADIAALPVGDLAAEDCALFLWISWPMLPDAMRIIEAWGFSYKTCAFDWMKARADQVEMFEDSITSNMGMGYWTRANSEPCLLATRGKPRRKSADVRMGVIEPRREHSRKPDCVPERIMRLVDGPYLELFARTRRPGWDVAFSNESEKFAATAAQ